MLEKLQNPERDQDIQQRHSFRRHLHPVLLSTFRVQTLVSVYVVEPTQAAVCIDQFLPILNKDQFLSHSTILVPNQVEVMISPLAPPCHSMCAVPHQTLAVRRLRRELKLQRLLTTTLPSCIYIHVYTFIYKTHHRHY